MERAVRVLIVDDSAFMRHRLAKRLDVDPGITVVGKAYDGLDALSQIKALNPDVVTLDVEMPRMDGLTALRRIMAECPTPVIMLSAATQRGARVTIKALMRGAIDFVAKPAANENFYSIIKELTAKIKIAAGVRSSSPPHSPTPALADIATPPSLSPARDVPRPKPRAFRKDDRLIVIGASTGGPRALQQVLSDLPADLAAAVVVVQHLPPGFTRALAQRLDENSPLTVHEAAHDDRLAQGMVLLAPGGSHLHFSGRRQVRLSQGPRRNGVRPAVDVTMESAAACHGSAVIGVVLTGMGVDGTAGARHVKAVGGKVIVEDESSSVVYGMPRSVVEAGLADRVVPLSDVALTLVELVK
jgi:two-component system chemotaxis response regulator CheB